MAESAFGQIRLFSQCDIAVSLRLLRTLCDIATAIPTKSDNRLLVEHGQQIVSGCAKALADEDLKELGARLELLKKLSAGHLLRNLV